ncbi:protein of unknown function [Acidithiobacillus ferrivorans]|uniref:Uncharacterized protein n=1 Tax=Acidithiobacillus ferrivorans TaxID=160808 RepID=A0A060UPJ5_9PROT|nr:hypothetical protein [Acidithiobacillus ferrivorans]CDQ10211.1 hypothetical protein AFERRI_40163 [Acidithiobacillus ferrivorans]SMH64172.1 protein of unknown function [Acidithiobacillus ferrivorans]
MIHINHPPAAPLKPADTEIDALEAERAEIWKNYAHESLHDMHPLIAQDVCEAFAESEGEMREKLDSDRSALPDFVSAESIEKMSPEQMVITQNRECAAFYALREFRAQAVVPIEKP